MINFQEVNTCAAVDFRISAPVLDEAIKHLVSLGSKYSLDPHVTLLLSPSTEEGFKKSVDELKSYLSSLQPFEITLDQFDYEEKSRFLKVEIVSTLVREIHTNLLKIVGKHRNGEIRAKDLARIDQGKYNEAEIEHLRKYGFLYCADRFAQKITLGNIPETVEADTVIERIKKMVEPVLGKKITINEINLMFHTDAPTQSEMKVLVLEKIRLV